MNASGRRPTHNGLTLLELIAVVLILGTLALIALPRVSGTLSTARENTCLTNKAEINRAVERYFIQTGGFPASINDLDDPNILPDGLPNCPVASVPYTLDAVKHRVQGHTLGNHP